MTRARSVLAEVGGFGIAVAAISLACAFAVIVALPDPPARRMSVDAAAAALGGTPVAGLATRTGAMPEGMRASLVERLLAQRLGLPAADVRATWVDPPNTPPRPARPPDRVILVRRQGAARTLIAAETLAPALARAIAAAPQPAFIAGVRGADGRWRTVVPARELLSGWRLRLLAALAASLLPIAALTWLFARRLTRPFRALTDDLPPVAAGPREVRAAVATIAAMRDRLAHEAEERTRMLAAMAHDLRTPLTGLRLRAETAPDAPRARMVADIARMEAMIAEVLAFARRGSDGRVVVALRPLLAEIAAEAVARGEAVTLAPGGDATVAADPAHLRRAVENLVRNAVDHAGGGDVALTADAATASIAVADRGPGIPAAERARLLRPFERGDASRSRDTGGTGLGLAIVADFAARHGGDLTLADRAGGGTAATLSLPRAPAPAADQAAASAG